MIRHASLRCPFRPRLSVDPARSLPLQLTLLLAIGCVGTGSPGDRGEPAENGCRPGEIRSLTDGRGYRSLEEALTLIRDQHELCIGEGRYHLDTLLLRHGPEEGAEANLRIVGAGSDRTFLVGRHPETSDESTVLHLSFTGPDSLDGFPTVGSIAVEGVGFEELTLGVRAQQVSLADLGFVIDGGLEPFYVDALQLVGERLVMRGSTVGPSVACTLNAAEVELRELELSDNVLGTAAPIYATGALTLVDPVVRGNTCAEDACYALFWVDGRLRVVGGELSGNLVPGVLVEAYGGVELEGVEVDGNEVGGDGLLTTFEPSSIVGGSVRGNRTGQAALLVNHALALDGVDMGSGDEDNEPCDVGPLGPDDDEQPCHPDALGEDTTVVCDRDGCG